MTRDLLDILRHTLGLDRSDMPFRNHFAAATGTPDYARCERLTTAGMMKRGAALSYGHYFHVTEQGLRALDPALAPLSPDGARGEG